MSETNKRHFMTNVNPNTFTTRPEIEGTFGVVTSTHWIATAVGMSILEKGGNAFDAGAATAFTTPVAGRPDRWPGTGLRAAVVPGTFESWMLLLRDYGTLRRRDVLEPAISYARDGYPLVERVSATIQTVEKL